MTLPQTHLICEVCDHEMTLVAETLPHCSYCFFTKTCPCEKAESQEHTCFYTLLAELNLEK